MVAIRRAYADGPAVASRRPTGMAGKSSKSPWPLIPRREAGAAHRLLHGRRRQRMAMGRVARALDAIEPRGDRGILAGGDVRDDDASSRRAHTRHLRGHTAGRLEVVQRIAAQDQRERRVGVRQGIDVADLELGVLEAELAAALARELDHRRRQIDAGGARHLRRGCRHEDPGPADDVEDGVGGARPRRVQERLERARIVHRRRPNARARVRRLELDRQLIRAAAEIGAGNRERSSRCRRRCLSAAFRGLPLA